MVTNRLFKKVLVIKQLQESYKQGYQEVSREVHKLVTSLRTCPKLGVNILVPSLLTLA